MKSPALSSVLPAKCSRFIWATGLFVAAMPLQAQFTGTYGTDFECASGGGESGGLKLFLDSTPNIHNQHGWAVEQGTAEIQTVGGGAGGGCFLKLSSSPAGRAKLTLSAPSGPLPERTFLDFCVKPVAVPLSTAEQGLVSVDGAWFGFFRATTTSTSAQLYLFDGDGAGGGAWVGTNVQITVDATSGAASEWVRVVMRQDFVRQTWDLYTGPITFWEALGLRGADFGFALSPVNRTETYFASGATTGGVSLDQMRIQNSNPAFADTDGDGIPDSVDLQPTVDDRDADADGDGASNLYEYLFASNSTDGDSLSYLDEARYGTNPTLTDTDGDGVSDSTEVTNGTNPRNHLDSIINAAVDRMQNIAISAASGDGAVYAVSLYELQEDGGEIERQRLLVSSATESTHTLLCRSTSQYKVRSHRYPSGTSTGYTLNVIATPVTSPAVPSGTALPTVKDHFCLLRPSGATGLPAVTTQCTDGSYHVIVKDTPPVVFETTDANGAVLASRLENILLRESANGVFHLKCRHLRSGLDVRLYTDWAVKVNGALYNPDLPLSDGDTVTLRRPPVSSEASTAPRILVRTGGATGPLIAVGETTVRTQERIPDGGGGGDPALHTTAATGCGCSDSSTAPAGDAKTTNQNNTSQSTAGDAMDSGMRVDMSAGNTAAGGVNSAQMNAGIPSPAQLRAHSSNFQFTETPHATSGGFILDLPAGSIPGHPTATGVKVTDSTTSPTGQTLFFNQTSTYTNGARLTFENYRYNAALASLVRTSTTSIDYSRPAVFNSGAQAYFSGYPLSAGYTAWERRVTRSADVMMTGTASDSPVEITKFYLLQYGSTTLRREDSFLYDHSPAPVLLQQSLRLFRIHQWGAQLLEERRIPVPSDFTKMAAVFGAGTYALPDTLRSYTYWTSGGGREALLKGSISREVISGTLQTPLDWTFQNFDAYGRLIERVSSWKGGDFTPDADGYPVTAVKNANRLLTTSWATGYQVTVSQYLAGTFTGSSTWLLATDWAGDNTSTVTFAQSSPTGPSSRTVNEITYSDGRRVTTSTRPDRGSFISYAGPVSAGNPAGATLTVDNAEGTRTARYQTTHQPLQKVETTTIVGGQELIISNSTYNYEGMDAGEAWRFDRDYTVTITHSDGTFERSVYTHGMVTSGLRRDGSAFSRTYDGLGRLQTETVTSSGGRGPLGENLAAIQITSITTYDALGNVALQQRQTGGAPVSIAVPTTLSTGQTISTLAPETGLLTTSWTWRDYTASRTFSENRTYTASGATFVSVSRTRGYLDGTAIVSSRSLLDGGAAVPVSSSHTTVDGTYVISTSYRFAPTDTASEAAAETATPAEWTQSFTQQGRTVRTVRSGGADTYHYYNAAGQLLSITSGEAPQIYEYDPVSGEVSREGSDLDNSGILDSSGWDRITRYVRDYVAGEAPGYAARRVEGYQYTTAFATDEVLVSRSLSEHTGTQSKSYSLNASGISTSLSWRTGSGAAGDPVTLRSRQTYPNGTAFETLSEYGTLITSKTDNTSAVTISRTRREYDSRGRLSKSHDIRTGTTQYVYPNEFRVITISPAPDLPTWGMIVPVTDTLTDALGRTTRVTSGKCHSTNAEEVTGFNVLPWDTDATLTNYTYNPAGQQLSQRQGLGYPVDYAYDRQGRMVSMTTYKGMGTASPQPAITSWAYNARGLLASKTCEPFDENGNGTDEPARTVYYTYTPQGRLATRTWARGLATTYHYHPFSGDLSYIDYSDNTHNRDLAFTYHRTGEVFTVLEGNLAGVPEYAIAYISTNGNTGDLYFYDGYNNWILDNLANNFNFSAAPPGWLGAFSNIFDQIEGENLSSAIAAYYFELQGGVPGYQGTVEVEADVFSEDGEVHQYNYETAPLAAGLPSIRRLYNEVIYGRLSEAVTLERNYGDGTAGKPAGLTSGYLVDIGLDTQLDIGYTWGVNGKLAQLDAHFPDNFGDGVPQSHWRTTYAYGVTGSGTDTDGTMLSSTTTCRIMSGNTVSERLKATRTYDSGRDSLALLTNQRKHTGTWQTISSHGYTVNALGQRTRHEETLETPELGTANFSTQSVNRDYLYNTRGEVASAATNNAVNLPHPAQQENEQFVYDTIGNRKWHARNLTAPSSAPADTDTAPSGSVSYTSSKANTYNSITGTEQGVTSAAALQYDADGNLLFDGAFLYTWDAENRLVSLRPAVPQSGDCDLIFSYDWLSRRRERTTAVHYNAGGGSVGLYPLETQKFVYEGWNPVLNIHTYLWGDPAVYVDRYVWGQDLSGSLQGAGGVGGLILTQMSGWSEYGLPFQDTTFLYSFDGNGNVCDVIGGSGEDPWFVNSVEAEVYAQFRYDSFGRRVRGPYQGGFVRDSLTDILIPFTFSTKWEENTRMESFTGPSLDARTRTLHYYGYRYYWADAGRWVSRDPIEEQGGKLLVAFLNNDGINQVDKLGKSAWTATLAGFTLDVATPEPSDPVPHKWVVWGFALVGAGIVTWIQGDSDDGTETKPSSGSGAATKVTPQTKTGVSESSVIDFAQLRTLPGTDCCYVWYPRIGGHKLHNNMARAISGNDWEVFLYNPNLKLGAGFDVGLGFPFGPTSVGEVKTGGGWIAAPEEQRKYWWGLAVGSYLGQMLLQHTVAHSCSRPYAVYWNNRSAVWAANFILPGFRHVYFPFP